MLLGYVHNVFLPFDLFKHLNATKMDRDANVYLAKLAEQVCISA